MGSPQNADVPGKEFFFFFFFFFCLFVLLPELFCMYFSFEV